MKLMKMNFGRLIGASACAVVFGLATQANAIPVRLDTSPYAPPAALEPDSAGNGYVEAWMQTLVTSYNTVAGASLPAVGLTAVNVSNDGVDPDGAGPLPGFGTGVTSITLPVDSYLYLAIRWGGPQADQWQAFYIGGATAGDTATFDTPGNGFSDYRFYNQRETVPDGGMTIMLLGIALGGLGYARRLVK